MHPTLNRALLLHRIFFLEDTPSGSQRAVNLFDERDAARFFEANEAARHAELYARTSVDSNLKTPPRPPPPPPPVLPDALPALRLGYTRPQPQHPVAPTGALPGVAYLTAPITNDHLRIGKFGGSWMSVDMGPRVAGAPPPEVKNANYVPAHYMDEYADRFIQEFGLRWPIK